MASSFVLVAENGQNKAISAIRLSYSKKLFINACMAIKFSLSILSYSLTFYV